MANGRFTCQECGREFVREGRGRNPRFCGRPCQVAWLNRQPHRRRASNRRAERWRAMRRG